MTNIITMGSGDLFIDLTRVFTRPVEGERIDRKHREPDTRVVVTEEFSQNISEMLRMEDFTLDGYGNSDFAGLPVRPETVVCRPGGNYTSVIETREEIKQKIKDAKVEAAQLVAVALGLLPADTARRPAAPVI